MTKPTDKAKDFWLRGCFSFLISFWAVTGLFPQLNALSLILTTVVVFHLYGRVRRIFSARASNASGKKPGLKPECTSESAPGLKPELLSESKPGLKAELPSESKPGLKPECTSESAPGRKPELPSESAPGRKPEFLSESKPGRKAEVKGTPPGKGAPEITAPGAGQTEAAKKRGRKKGATTKTGPRGHFEPYGRFSLLAGVFSLLFACAAYAGSLLDLEEKIVRPGGAFSPLHLLGIFGVVFPLIFLLLDFVCIKCPGKRPERADPRENHLPSARHPRWIPWAAGGLILLCYSFTYLMYFPAATTFDSWTCLLQAMGRSTMNDWHPFLYTLALRLFTGHALWEVSTGVALFAFAQMLWMAACGGYCVGWLDRRGARRAFSLLTALYFALTPLFAIFSITLWKDIPFAGAALLYSLCLFDLAASNGALLCRFSGVLRYVLLAFLTGMLRHNGYYVVLAITLILPVYFLVTRKPHGLRIAGVLLVSAALIPAANHMAYAAGVERAPSTEAFSIPLQQVAAVYREGKISPAELPSMERLFDLETLETYDPILADPAKNSIRQGYFDEHKGEFLKLWLSLGRKNPRLYGNAYLLQTHGYWHIGDRVAYIIDPSANRFEEIGVQKQSLLQRNALTNFLTSRMYPCDLPSLGGMVWTMLLGALILLAKKQYPRLMGFLPALGVWGTLLVASPLSNSMRYLYLLPLVLPVLVFSAFQDPAQPTDPEAEEREGNKERKKERNSGKKRKRDRAKPSLLIREKGHCDIPTDIGKEGFSHEKHIDHLCTSLRQKLQPRYPGKGLPNSPGAGNPLPADRPVPRGLRPSVQPGGAGAVFQRGNDRPPGDGVSAKIDGGGPVDFHFTHLVGGSSGHSQGLHR